MNKPSLALFYFKVIFLNSAVKAIEFEEKEKEQEQVLFLEPQAFLHG